MARPKDLNLAHAWRQRLHRQLSSGLSISAFCAREGVSSASFHAWKRRLTARSLPARPQPPLFVPLHLDSSHPTTPAGAGRWGRDRVAPPGPTPLRGPARARMAGTPRHRSRRPPTPGGHIMILLPSAVRIFLCTRSTDLRKSFDGLSGAGSGMLRPGPLDRPSLPLPQPPQGSDQDPLL